MTTHKSWMKSRCDLVKKIELNILRLVVDAFGDRLGIHTEQELYEQILAFSKGEETIKRSAEMPSTSPTQHQQKQSKIAQSVPFDENDALAPPEESCDDFEEEDSRGTYAKSSSSSKATPIESKSSAAILSGGLKRGVVEIEYHSATPQKQITNKSPIQARDILNAKAAQATKRGKQDDFDTPSPKKIRVVVLETEKPKNSPGRRAGLAHLSSVLQSTTTTTTTTATKLPPKRGESPMQVPPEQQAPKKSRKTKKSDVILPDNGQKEPCLIVSDTHNTEEQHQGDQKLSAEELARDQSLCNYFMPKTHQFCGSLKASSSWSCTAHKSRGRIVPPGYAQGKMVPKPKQPNATPQTTPLGSENVAQVQPTHAKEVKIGSNDLKTGGKPLAEPEVFDNARSDNNDSDEDDIDTNGEKQGNLLVVAPIPQSYTKVATPANIVTSSALPYSLASTTVLTPMARNQLAVEMPTFMNGNLLSTEKPLLAASQIPYQWGSFELWNDTDTMQANSYAPFPIK